jgi:multiple sugar transport system ATP-binding protein
MNLVEARIERNDGSLEAVVGESRLALDGPSPAGRSHLAAYEGRQVVLGVRPEDLEDAAVAESDNGLRLRGRVELREALGSEVLVHIRVQARQAVTEDVRELAEDVGDDRTAGLLTTGEGSTTATLIGRFSPRSRVLEGDLIEVTVAERALHCFDADTGLAIT